MATIDLRGLLSSMTSERTQKYQEGLNTLQELLTLLDPQRISGQERTALAGVGQSAVSRGLSNTTVPIAQTAAVRSEFEDIRKSRLGDAFNAIAGYMQAGTPTAGEIGVLATGASSALTAEKEAKAAATIAANDPLTQAKTGTSGTSSKMPSWRPAQRLGTRSSIGSRVR